LKALCYKGFTEQVFGKLLSKHKKHQKEQLLEDPAARSHNSEHVLLQAARKPRLVTCAEAQRGTQKRVGASSNALRVSVQILCA
jgi:predicted DNA repair protein MutK